MFLFSLLYSSPILPSAAEVRRSLTEYCVLHLISLPPIALAEVSVQYFWRQLRFPLVNTDRDIELSAFASVASKRRTVEIACEYIIRLTSCSSV